MVSHELSKVHVLNGLSPFSAIDKDDLNLDSVDLPIPANTGVGAKYALAVKIEATFLAAWLEMPLRNCLLVMDENAATAELIANKLVDAIANFMLAQIMKIRWYVVVSQLKERNVIEKMISLFRSLSLKRGKMYHLHESLCSFFTSSA